MSLHKRWVFCFRGLAFCSFLLIAYLATTPQENVINVPQIDKANHILAFFVLLFLVDFSFPHSTVNGYKLSLLAGFALIIELVQSYLPYRHFSWWDLMADFVGMTLYLMLIPLFKRLPILRTRWT